MSFGLRVVGPNGTKVVLSEAMRYPRIMFQHYFDMYKGAQTIIPCTDADDDNKVLLVVSLYEIAYATVYTSSYGSAFLNFKMTTYPDRVKLENTGNAGNWRSQGDITAIRVG